MSSIIKSRNVKFSNSKNSFSNVSQLNGNILDNESIISEANKEKEKIIENAVKSAREIIEKANESKFLLQKEVIDECSVIKEKAFKSGFEEGKIKGEQEAYQSLKAKLESEKENVVAELLKHIYSIEESKDEILKKYEDKMINISVDIAKKIIKTELSTDKNIVRNMLEDALANYKKCEWIKVYVNEDDFVTVSTDEKIADMLTKISEHVKIEKVQDSKLGDLVIETPDNIMNLGTDNQIKNLENIIMGVQEN